MAIRDRLINFLATGMTQEEAARTVGCDPSYVSQLLSTDDFVQDLDQAKKQLVKDAQAEEQEARMNKLEDVLVNSLMQNAPFASFSEVTKAMEMLIRAKTAKAMREGKIQGPVFQQNNFINLSLPQAAAPEIVLNTQKEIIAVGEKTLAPMPAKGVKNLFTILEEKKKKAAEQATQAFLDAQNNRTKNAPVVYEAVKAGAEDFMELSVETVNE